MVNASWTASNNNLCLNSGAASECWPYSQAFQAGQRVTLTSKEFQLLAYFLQRPGCALSRDVILNAVWGHAVFVLPRSIDRCITTLRAKIEPDPRNPRYVQTIRDVGYRFEP